MMLQLRYCYSLFVIIRYNFVLAVQPSIFFFCNIFFITRYGNVQSEWYCTFDLQHNIEWVTAPSFYKISTRCKRVYATWVTLQFRFCNTTTTRSTTYPNPILHHLSATYLPFVKKKKIFATWITTPTLILQTRLPHVKDILQPAWCCTLNAVLQPDVRVQL